MFSWFQTQLNMEIRFVCARKGVVLSPSAAATHTRVNFVKKANTNYYKLFFYVSFVHFFCLCLFRLYDSKQIWITRALCWNVAIRRRGTTNRKTRPIFKSHLPRNSSLMLVSWLFQFTNVEKSTRKTHLNSNPKASKQKMIICFQFLRFFDNRKLV